MLFAVASLVKSKTWAMDNQNQNQANSNNSYSSELDSLEAQTTVVEDSSTTSSSPPPPGKEPEKKRRAPRSIKRILDHFNIYLLLFGLIILVAAVVTVISIIQSRKANEQTANQITSEPLSEEALSQLRQTDVKIGDPKQILSVESNAVFAGKVLVRDSLEVAGEIKTGKSLTVPGLTVTGTTLMGQIQANQLQLTGGATIQGQVSIQNNLSVSGSGSFGGSLTAASLNIQNLQINGDIQFTRHIDAGGGTPGKTDGSALGRGGTSSVSGTDSAGSVAINTGSGTGAGCFVTVNFTQRYNGTPHVVITPVGSAGASIDYYINRSNTNFSICTANAAPAGQSFAFDYVAID